MTNPGALDLQTTSSKFEQAGRDQDLSLFRELCLFVVEGKRWWMVPILLVVALVGALFVLSQTSLGAMIYSLI